MSILRARWRIEERSREAQERDALTALLTPEVRLTILNNRLGKDVGARKERKRLLKRIEERDKPKVSQKSKGKQNPKGKKGKKSDS